MNISTRNMPEGLRDRAEKILNHICDNYQSYKFNYGSLLKIRSLRDKFYGVCILDENEFKTLHEAFCRYYKEPDRAKALHKWWVGEVAKIVFSELGD